MQPEVHLVSIEEEVKRDTNKGGDEKKNVGSSKAQNNGTENGQQTKSGEAEAKENGVSNGKVEDQKDSKSDSKAKDQKEEQNHQADIVEEIILVVEDEEVEADKAGATERTKPEDIEASFTSYNESTMLSEPVVKVNDNVQENVNLGEVASALEKPKSHESFGGTLKRISGRRSLTRNVTFRDRVFSPDSSMFVNVSMSTPGRGDLDSSINGSFVERKRKRDLDESPVGKKAKTEEGGLLGSPLRLLRSFRRSKTAETSPTKSELSESHEEEVAEEKKTIKQQSAHGLCRLM